MLNQWSNLYTDIGAGVAEWGAGRYVMILNVCKVIGQEASGDIPDTPVNDGVPAVAPTTDFSNYIYGVVTATPQFDGTVTHVVKYGQTLLTIAEAYGITVDELRALNGFAADFTAIWPEDELIIKKGTGEAAPTPSPTVEVAETTPTPTPRPTYTPSSMDLTATANAANNVEETEEAEPARSNLTAGMFLLVFSGLGLVIVVFVMSLKKDGAPPAGGD